MGMYTVECTVSSQCTVSYRELICCTNFWCSWSTRSLGLMVSITSVVFKWNDLRSPHRLLPLALTRDVMSLSRTYRTHDIYRVGCNQYVICGFHCWLDALLTLLRFCLDVPKEHAVFKGLSYRMLSHSYRITTLVICWILDVSEFWNLNP
jgi:hypothetical protein